MNLLNLPTPTIHENVTHVTYGCGMFHPWQALRALTHIAVRWVPLEGRLGDTDGLTDIRLHPHQTGVQLRCTLTHELAHIALGHIGGCSDSEEKAAEHWAALRLITMTDLKAALRWTDNPEEAAEELCVDLDTLESRLECLTEDEWKELAGMRTDTEQGA